MTTISKGKFQGIENVADDTGIIRAAAMDQRGSLKKSLALEKDISPEDITDEIMEEFKTAVIKVLSPYASGVLLDPEYGLKASQFRHSEVGLLMAYEKSGYDNTQGGRIPLLLPNWTVRQSLEAGANCVKLLVYYSPFEDFSINEQKHVFVERIGAECAFHDIPFFLEFVGYDSTGKLQGLDYARLKPEIVTESMREFSKDIYNVDILKVEIPVDLKYTKGCQSFEGSEEAYSKEEAKELYLKAAQAARRPFIYLSAGVSDSQFRESLELAVESGVMFSGVLCGRATWKESIPVYASQGVTALEDWLSERGVENIRSLNKILTGAHSWKDFYGEELEIV